MDLLTEVRKVLICGLGSIGKRHLQILRQYWKDIDLAILRSGHGGYVYESELVEHVFTSLGDAVQWNPDAAIIATPASKHLSVALPLARHGVPLFIEKPVGDGTEPQHYWQELVRLSVSVPIEVGYTLRHDPCTEYVKSHIRDRLIGTLLEADFYCGSWLPDWRPGVDYRVCVSANRALGGGVLLELSHELDLAQYLLGSLKLLSAHLHQSGLLQIDVEDLAHLLAYTEDHCLISIRLNFCTQPAARHVCIRGSDGEIRWDIIDGKVQVVHTATRDVKYFQSPISSDERYRLQMDRFLSCAARKTQPVCSVLEGLSVLNIANQARDLNSQFEV